MRRAGFTPVPPVPVPLAARALSMMATVDAVLPEQLERLYGLSVGQAQQVLLRERARRVNGGRR